jgi:hypothetical protein
VGFDGQFQTPICNSLIKNDNKAMKLESELFESMTPRVGCEFIKLKTGEIVKWESMHDATQTFEFRSKSGELCTVHRRDVEFPTTEEELEHLRKQNLN